MRSKFCPNQYTLLGTLEGRIDRRTVSHGWIYKGETENGVMLKFRHPAQIRVSGQSNTVEDTVPEAYKKTMRGPNPANGSYHAIR